MARQRGSGPAASRLAVTWGRGRPDASAKRAEKERWPLPRPDSLTISAWEPFDSESGTTWRLWRRRARGKERKERATQQHHWGKETVVVVVVAVAVRAVTAGLIRRSECERDAHTHMG